MHDLPKWIDSSDELASATVPVGRGGRAFGGALMAYSLLHAAQSAPLDFDVHSLHAQFLRPGTAPGVVSFTPTTLRMSRRFRTTRVEADQHGDLLCSVITSFHARETSPDHAARPPSGVGGDPQRCRPASGGAIPPPESPIRAPFDLRAAEPVEPQPDRRPRLGYWLRLHAGSSGPRGDTAALAWASDFVLTRVADLEYETDPRWPRREAASLDQALWFNRPVDLSDWVYYEVISPSYGGAIALSTGTVHDRNGHLLATVAQQSLLRRGGDPP